MNRFNITFYYIFVKIINRRVYPSEREQTETPTTKAVG
jgi:hypothetical protein